MGSESSAVARVPSPGAVRAFVRRYTAGDEVAHIITLLFAASIIAITSLLVYELWIKSKISRAHFGWDFLFTRTWDPVFEHFGALPFIFGTIVTSAIALTIALPLGLAAAVFLSELAPRAISDTISFLIDLLAAVPSVIYGLLGIFIVVPLMRTVIGPALKDVFGFLPLFSGPNYGVGFLTAGIVLAIMVVPFIISVSREVLLTVPRDQREAAFALGATRWEATWKVVVPWARTGITGSVFLALARAVGETMAVTMVIGNAGKISTSLFAPGDTIAATLASQFSEATGDLYLSSLIELGLVLFLITFILNGLARLLIIATERGGGHAA
ncbi:MAG TPA: phosphate ABC transporter permease subunit PstC [Candidatus Acidoferrales bacterium]|nr:phosphate ABC transporter permease subunit PstC [Candidatus Acidoferrales bacterium]